MNERFLQYVWHQKLFDANLLQTTDSQPVEVLYQGDLNTNAGPDFLNARIKIGSMLWVGNVELHLKSNDWYAHNHHTDCAYNNVILHVVNEFSEDVSAQNQTIIPSLILEPPKSLLDAYESFCSSDLSIPCESSLGDFNSFELRFWFSKLVAERFEQKYNHIKTICETTKNDWDAVLFKLIAEAFGANVNKEPFSLLVERIPLHTVRKHRNSLFQLEALLFGTASLLEVDEIKDDYILRLQKEYDFLQKKYLLEPIPKVMWKFSKLRPYNSPYIRIAQLASILAIPSMGFTQITEQENDYFFKRLHECEVSEFWQNHYTFSKSSKKQSGHLTDRFINHLVINVVAPLKFAYGAYVHDEHIQEQAFSMLEQISPEANSIVSKWNDRGITTDSAFETQALIHMQKHYCNSQECLRCNIGNAIVRRGEALLSVK